MRGEEGRRELMTTFEVKGIFFYPNLDKVTKGKISNMHGQHFRSLEHKGGSSHEKFLEPPLCKE